MQVTLKRLMSKIEYLIVPKGTKFTGSGKLGLSHLPNHTLFYLSLNLLIPTPAEDVHAHAQA